jgi:NADH:ubiquinone oxidoreductase subunit 5 (subunit L)/multisubunit Na+/H+ antiporter MnhA subunit
LTKRRSPRYDDILFWHQSNTEYCGLPEPRFGSKQSAAESLGEKEMDAASLLLFALCIPLFGAFLLPLIGRGSPKARNLLALGMVAAPFGLLLFALPAANTATPLALHVSLPLGLSFGLMADGLGVFMALTASFIGLIIVVYSWGYMAHYGEQNEYYLCVVLFVGAMMGITLTTDLVFLYVFWEISAFCCWRLIGFFREKEYVRRANKAFLITGAGALLMLGGFLMVYALYGTTDLLLLRGKAIPGMAVALMLMGIFAKSATLPLHSWLADAGIAPSPVTALLHAAVLVKIGVFAYARLFLVTFSIGDVWHTVVPIIAAVSALLSAGAAIAETDLKRIIAYSTVSQLAFIFLGLSVGGELAAAGGLLYILMHGISKAGLFLCAGIVEHNCHTKDIRKLGGLLKTMPLTGAAFLLCAFSVMGIPPFGGFFSKYMVISGAVEAGQPWIAFTFLLGAVMTVIYLLRVFARVFLGQPGEASRGVREGSPAMVGSVTALGALSALSGIAVSIPAAFVQSVVQQMGVMVK